MTDNLFQLGQILSFRDTCGGEQRAEIPYAILIMRRKKDHRSHGGKTLDLLKRLQAAGARHGNIEDYQVGRFRDEHFEGLNPVPCQDYAISFVCKRGTTVLTNILLIVGKEYGFHLDDLYARQYRFIPLDDMVAFSAPRIGESRKIAENASTLGKHGQIGEMA